MRDEFRHCDKYGLIRSYKMETDFMITAKQVEALLVILETRITGLEKLISELLQDSPSLKEPAAD